MSEFKHINVVEDNTSNVTLKKPHYKLLEEHHDNTVWPLIEALHGTSLDHAGQHYLFDNPDVFAVYVKKYLAEFNYEKSFDVFIKRNPNYQIKLKKEADEFLSY